MSKKGKDAGVDRRIRERALSQTVINIFEGKITALTDLCRPVGLWRGVTYLVFLRSLMDSSKSSIVTDANSFCLSFE